MQLEVGAIVSGKVIGITAYGAFVELENGKTGMVHISEVATVYVKEISDHLQIGQEIKVKVLDIAADGKISLSLKRAAAPAPSRPSAPQRQRAAVGAPRDHGAQKQSNEPKSFDDMLSKFMSVSDEKLSSLDRGERRSSRRSSGSRHRNDYYDD